MIRERKRPDWPVSVMKFWARPQGEIPQVVWENAREQQRVWSELITLRARYFEQAKGLEGEAKKQTWVNYHPDMRSIVKASSLKWDTQDDILLRFNAAAKEASRSGTALEAQTKLKKVRFLHRFTSGGLPAERVFRSLATKTVGCEPIDPKAYGDNTRINRRKRITTGAFALDGQTINVETILHRPLPQQAFVKSVLLCGNFLRNRGPNKDWWEWSLQFVVEAPPSPAMLMSGDHPTCGIDFGWRVMAEGEYLRVAYVVDSEGRRFEIRLPLEALTVRQRKFARRQHRKGVDHFYHGWYGLIDLDKRIGDAVEDCKARIRDLIEPGDRMGFTQIRQSGLARLLRKLAEEDRNHDAMQEIEAFFQRERQLRERRNALDSRLISRRRWIYRNVASWLTQRYRAIAWEEELDLKRMAEEKGKAPALQAADRYRQWAAIGELRTYIAQAALKNQSQIKGKETANSTRTCCECRGKVESGAGLYTTCVNGHENDQDENAASLFLCEELGIDAHELRQRQAFSMIDLPEVFGGIAQL